MLNFCMLVMECYVGPSVTCCHQKLTRTCTCCIFVMFILFCLGFPCRLSARMTHTNRDDSSNIFTFAYMKYSCVNCEALRPRKTRARLHVWLYVVVPAVSYLFGLEVRNLEPTKFCICENMCVSYCKHPSLTQYDGITSCCFLLCMCVCVPLYAVLSHLLNIIVAPSGR